MKMDENGVAWPHTEAELVEYLRTILDGNGEWAGDSGYERSANALWQGALATFNYISHVVGATGFQAGWAGLNIVQHTNHIEPPFAIITSGDLLYPQYDLRGKVEHYIAEWTPIIAERAAKKLGELDSEDQVHPHVLAHWKELASTIEEGKS